MTVNPTKFPSLSDGLDAVSQHLLKNGKPIDNQYWQAKKIEGVYKSFEVENVSFTAPIPDTKEDLAKEVEPNLEWADEHFGERVSGIAMNPMPSYVRWPFWVKDSNFSLEVDGKKFSHTYAERFWPKFVKKNKVRKGIRFDYGDTNDVVNLLARDPYTRQAFLTIWHPEDNGQVHKMRVPCTIGYHFMMRDDHLHMHYVIRSCDALRYLRDDTYMACRLGQWVLDRLREKDTWWENVKMGDYTFHCFSLHIFQGDIPIMEMKEKQRKDRR